MPTISKRFSQARRGLLEYAVLTIIDAAHPTLSLKEILKVLQRTEFSTTEGTLYPLLSRLTRENLVIRGFEESDFGRARKYYTITSEGKRALKSLDQYWQKIASTIKKFNQPTQTS